MKYIVTAAQREANVNKEFLHNLEVYAKYQDVDKIYILPMAGKSIKETDLDEYFYENDDKYEIINRDTILSKRIKISNYAIRPQQIIPTTGLARFAQNDISTIFASPKQALKIIPNSVGQLPKALITTGACTEPNYRTTNRIGQIAKRDHQYGFTIVECNGNKDFHFRQVESLNNGKFMDLDYSLNKKMSKSSVDAIVLMDTHVGETNKKVEKVNQEMLRHYKPKFAIFHDLFNGSSINHHEMNDYVIRSKKGLKGQLSLEKELKMVYNKLWEYSTISPKTQYIVTKSNHDEFLNRYIQSGRFIEEPHNSYLSSKLFTKMIEGQDPLVEGLKTFGELPSNVRFLSRNEDFKVRGYQLGQHGDKGANGARGSIKTLEAAYGKSITGHKHTPEMFRNTYVVGTATDYDLDYVQGLSSWLHTNAFIYSNGKASLINVINGKYKL